MVFYSPVGHCFLDLDMCYVNLLLTIGMYVKCFNFWLHSINIDVDTHCDTAVILLTGYLK